MLYAIAAALVLVLDQAMKYFVTLKIALNDGVMQFIPGVMSLVNIHNFGMAFGALSEAGFRWCFVVVALAFAIGVTYALSTGRIKKPLFRWLFVLTAAGGLGNAIDRALYGYVVDMFRLDFIDFAVFNVADIFVTVGGILLCVFLILPEKKPAEESAESSSEDTPKKERLGLVLHSRKRAPAPPPAEVQKRRRAGKLYDDPAPINTEDPFAEFIDPAAPSNAAAKSQPDEGPMPEKTEPAAIEAAQAEASPARADAPKSPEELPVELEGITVDDILNELL